MSATRVAILLAVSGLLPISAEAQEWVYSTGSNTDAIHLVDLATGQVELVGAVHPDPDRYTAPLDIALRPSDGALFVANNSPAQDAGVSRYYGPGALPEVVIPIDRFCLTLRSLFFLPDDRLIVLDQCGILTEVFVDSGATVELGQLDGSYSEVAYNPINRSLFAFDGFSNRIVRFRTDGTVIETIQYPDPPSGFRASTFVILRDGRFLIATFRATYHLDVVTGNLVNVRAFFNAIWPQGMGWRLGFQPPARPVPTISQLGIGLLALGVLLLARRPQGNED